MDHWKSLGLFWGLWGAGIVAGAIGFIVEVSWLVSVGVILDSGCNGAVSDFLPLSLLRETSGPGTSKLLSPLGRKIKIDRANNSGGV